MYLRIILIGLLFPVGAMAQGTPINACSASQAVTGQYFNTGQACGNPIPSAATSSAVGGVSLASGETSTTLSKVATTGAYGDLTGAPAIPSGTVTNVSGATSGGLAVTTTSPGTTPVVSVAPDSTHVIPVNTGSASTCLTGAGTYTALSVPLKATTPSLGGSLISLGCTNQTAVTVTGATTAMGCYMSAAAGNPANTVPICSVTAANTVVPELCTAIALGITPTAKAYNMVLF